MVAYSFKERFVKPIEVGLSSVSLSFDPPPKRQTIREVGLKRHARPGEVLQLYYGMRTKYCRSIGVAKCVSADPIRMNIADEPKIWMQVGKDAAGFVTDEFARADGFASAEDMHEFWKKEHGLGRFEGVLIRWEPIR